MKCSRIIFPLLSSAFIILPQFAFAAEEDGQGNRVPARLRLGPRPEEVERAQAHRAARNQDRLAQHDHLMGRAQNDRLAVEFRTTSFLKLANAYIDGEIQDKTCLHRDFEDLNRLFPLAGDDRETDVHFALGKLAFFAGEYETAYRHYEVISPDMQGNTSSQNHLSIALAQLILEGRYTPPGFESHMAATQHAQELLESTHSALSPVRRPHAALGATIPHYLQAPAQPVGRAPLPVVVGAPAVAPPAVEGIHFDDLRTREGRSLRVHLETLARTEQRRLTREAAEAEEAAVRAELERLDREAAEALAMGLDEDDGRGGGGGGARRFAAFEGGSEASSESTLRGKKRKHSEFSDEDESEGEDESERLTKRKYTKYSTPEVQRAFLTALRATTKEATFDSRDIRRALADTVCADYDATQVKNALLSIHANPCALTPEEAREFQELYARRRPPAEPWTETEEETLIRLVNEGMGQQAIAERMHRNKGQINARVCKLRKGKKPAGISDEAWDLFLSLKKNRGKKQ